MDDDLLSLTTQIVSAHVSNHNVRSDQLPILIRSVHGALSMTDQAVTDSPKAEPAVSTMKSVFPDHLVCLDCGKGFRTLKRHLRSDHGMTPQEYRTKWELPPTYPVTAPGYAAQRSQLAKKSGLGRKAPVDPAPKKRGRQAKEK